MSEANANGTYHDGSNLLDLNTEAPMVMTLNSPEEDGVPAVDRVASRWKRSLLALTALNWACVFVAVVLDLGSSDAPTSMAIGAHSTLLVMVSFIGLFGIRGPVWQLRFGWPQRLVVICTALGVCDAVIVYFIGFGVLHVSPLKDQRIALFMTLSGISLLTAVSIPAALISLIVLMMKARRKPSVSPSEEHSLL